MQYFVERLFCGTSLAHNITGNDDFHQQEDPLRGSISENSYEWLKDVEMEDVEQEEEDRRKVVEAAPPEPMNWCQVVKRWQE